MRLAVVIALVFTASIALAQADLWSHVSPQSGPQHLQPATLSDAQLQSVARLFRHQRPGDVWECEGSELEDVIKGLKFETIPVPGKKDVVLAEAGAGCARGGQGSNGAMWVIRFDGADGATPTLLATPREFSGWLFAVLPATSHGYPDIVLGWHMSAMETGLSYMRFDGKSYRSVGAATLVADDEENEKIVPGPR